MLSDLALLALFSLPSPAVDTPAEWVGRLGGEKPDEAVAALVELAPEQTLPLLVDCVRTRPRGHAWQAGRVIHRLSAEVPRHQVWKGTAAALVGIVLDGEAEEPRRSIAALAMRGLGKAAKPMREDLVSLLEEESPAAVRVGVSLAVAGFGKDATSLLKKMMKGEGMMKMVWGATTLACMGKEGKSMKMTLVRLIEDEQSLTAFLACWSNVIALEKVAGEAAAKKPLLKRLKHTSGRIWSGGYGGINMGGVMPKRVEDFFPFLAARAKKPAPAFEEVALPEQFMPTMHGSANNFGDCLQSLCRHLTAEMVTLHEKLESGEIETWERWSEAADPIGKLAGLLNDMDAHVCPPR